MAEELNYGMLLVLCIFALSVIAIGFLITLYFTCGIRVKNRKPYECLPKPKRQPPPHWKCYYENVSDEKVEWSRCYGYRRSVGTDMAGMVNVRQTADFCQNTDEDQPRPPPYEMVVTIGM